MKYSREKASKVMRVVSILGVICLLALQWVWWRNAYRAVEMDFMSKAEGCVSEAVEKAIMLKLDSASKGLKVVNESLGESAPKASKQMVSLHSANNTKEFLFVMEEGLFLTKNAINATLIKKQLGVYLNDEFGYIPEYTIKIVKQPLELDSIEVQKYNRIAVGSQKDTIYKQIGFYSYATVIFESPISEFLRKGAFILLLSILLVLLIGGIMVFQFINMQRERKFSNFIIDYTRMIAHDLRTPVTSLQMIFKLFQKSSVSIESKEKYAVEGLSLTKKILLNLDNILYMAKSEQRELPVHKTEVNIRDFMEKTVNVYRERDYNPKMVDIETIYEPADFSCNMDESLMENVVCNLLDNAIKFTGMEAKIKVSCKREKDVVEWRFRDNGMGMSVEDQSRIFELFERGSSNKPFPGFGIGLHFVQRVVKAHSGKISVQSTVGEGSEFVVRFFS